MFKRGDRVKLTDQAILQIERGYGSRPRHHIAGRHHVDWAGRRGAVMHTPHPWSGGVNIRWDDRTSPENFPKGMIRHDDTERTP